MQERQVGHSGLRVSRLGLGTMTFGSQVDEVEAEEQLDAFLDAGGTLIERRLVDWTTGRIGFADGADGVFTSGGTQSNLQALLMARGETFLRGHVDPGLAYNESLSRFRVFCSRDAHFSVQKRCPPSSTP